MSSAQQHSPLSSPTCWATSRYVRHHQQVRVDCGLTATTEDQDETIGGATRYGEPTRSGTERDQEQEAHCHGRTLMARKVRQPHLIAPSASPTYSLYAEALISQHNPFDKTSQIPPKNSRPPSAPHTAIPSSHTTVSSSSPSSPPP